MSELALAFPWKLCYVGPLAAWFRVSRQQGDKVVVSELDGKSLRKSQSWMGRASEGVRTGWEEPQKDCAKALPLGMLTPYALLSQQNWFWKRLLASCTTHQGEARTSARQCFLRSLMTKPDLLVRMECVKAKLTVLCGM